MKQKLFWLPLLLFLYASIITCTPKLTVVFVIDNFSANAFSNIKPYLTGGIALLANNGLYYENAYWPHAIPSTAPGHTGLVTGTIPAHHGVIDNVWQDSHGKKTAFESDSAERAAVFAPTGFYDYGKSAHNLMVDTLADQILLKYKSYKVFSLSLKSRAAIAMAGTMGKAVWYDENSNQFTSSKAYFNALPIWVNSYNQTLKKELMTNPLWKLFFAKDSPAYARVNPDIYTFARKNQLVEQPITADTWDMTPAAITALLDLARACLAQEFSPDQKNPLILFISFSSTDKIFHRFGPTSFEYSDMLYHLDHVLKPFIETLATYAKPEDTLLLLTADHGGMPIVQELQQRGYAKALRINTESLKKDLNKQLRQKYCIENLVAYINAPNIYLNKTIMASCPKQMKARILRSLKKMLQQQPGIKKVWTFKELQKTRVCFDAFERLYQQQSFPGRTGDIIFQVFPYVDASKYDEGTGHSSPYAYDTHVPLILYQPGLFASKKILDMVFVPQVAPTLAQILGVPKPSATTFALLPGITLH